MRYFSLSAIILSVVTACCIAMLNVAIAGSINVGLNGGYVNADHDGLNDNDLYNAQLYCQYRFDGGFGIEGGYNVFAGGEVGSKDVTTHGPYTAASLNADMGENLDLFTRAGVMYALQDGDVESHQRISPFLGLGAQFAFTDNFYGRVGYDHYFKTNKTEEVEANLDLFYAGLGFAF